ncbi:MAG: hypothetical protein OYI31_02535 [Chloroflexota bacterium]|nr:hypothetical protein [Chloroflexota bacterium]MDE2940727.1 hypothetical protein [Chloroflexota bacterium]MDE3267323.1 hypothetical protein [Chloroflexota bacterium]
MTMHNQENQDPSDFFQEFVGRLFDELGYQPEEQPGIGSRKSDYLARAPDGESFYIEATVLTPDQFSRPRPTEDDVCRKLDRICHVPHIYSFWATASGELYQNLARRKLDPIKSWMEGLSAEDVAPQSERFSFPSGTPPVDAEAPSKEWRVEIHATPRPLAKRGIPARLLTRFGRGGGVDSASPLVRAARAKARQHKDVSKPLLLAMNDLADFPSDRIDISMALFGWEQASETGISRITPPQGYERRRSIWGTQENSTISAILLFHGLLPHTIPYAEVCLYENPSARYRLCPSIRDRFPHAVVEEKEGIGFLRWPMEQLLSSVLGIPPTTRPYAVLEREMNRSVSRIFRRLSA